MEGKTHSMAVGRLHPVVALALAGATALVYYDLTFGRLMTSRAALAGAAEAQAKPPPPPPPKEGSRYGGSMPAKVHKVPECTEEQCNKTWHPTDGKHGLAIVFFGLLAHDYGVADLGPLEKIRALEERILPLVFHHIVHHVPEGRKIGIYGHT